MEEKFIVELKKGDTFNVKTIKECCKLIFRCDALMGASYFRPQTLRNVYKDNYFVWFEHFNDSIHDYGTGRIWKNKISADGEFIEHSYLGKREFLIKERDLDQRNELIIAFDR